MPRASWSASSPSATCSRPSSGSSRSTSPVSPCARPATWPSTDPGGAPMATRRRPTEPHLARKARQKMAVEARGDPNEVLPQVLPALYGCVYRLKFGLKKAGKTTFKVGSLIARWPMSLDTPRQQWIGRVGLAIPASTRSLEQSEGCQPVLIETWDYGSLVAEIMHIGPYSTERPAIDRLLTFISASGYELAGVHEEEYLTSPNAKIQETIIRYPVRKIKNGS